jgi:carboxyl-terminal processing protease
VGETTFGKGLVQTVYNLSDNTGLALTTYHYYTPSGRLIQRDYKGISLYDYYYDHGGALPANTTNREVKFTDAGRTVYGGGGITPDEKIVSPELNDFQDTLLYSDVFFHFAPVYLASHTVDKNFQVNDAVLAEFKKYLTSQNIPWTEADLNGVMDWLKIGIKDQIFTIEFGRSQGLRTRAEWDPEIQKALTYLPEAQALEDNARKVLTEKAQARNEAP